MHDIDAKQDIKSGRRFLWVCVFDAHDTHGCTCQGTSNALLKLDKFLSNEIKKSKKTARYRKKSFLSFKKKSIFSDIYSDFNLRVELKCWLE